MKFIYDFKESHLTDKFGMTRLSKFTQNLQSLQIFDFVELNFSTTDFYTFGDIKTIKFFDDLVSIHCSPHISLRLSYDKFYDLLDKRAIHYHGSFIHIVPSNE